MKKLITIILATLTLLMVSCSKEYMLAGTKWLGGYSGETMDLTFTRTDFELKDANGSFAILGSYVYEAPNITFIATTLRNPGGQAESGGGSFTGVVKGKNAFGANRRHGHNVYQTIA